MSTGATRTKLNEYLKDFEMNLKPLSDEDISEIREEIESLILSSLENGGDKAGLEGVLAELGSPKTLASQYKAHIEDGKPLPLVVRLARGTARGASKTFRVFLAGLGYIIGGGFIVIALLKPFMPNTIGFWVGNGGLIIGYPGAQSGLEDLLGYWIIPLGLIFGAAVIFLTRKIDKHLK